MQDCPDQENAAAKEQHFTAPDNEEDGWALEASSDDAESEPPPETIVELFSALQERHVLKLDWQCPGRRPPSPAQDEFFQEEEEDSDFKPEEESDFDFKDELSAPKFVPRKGNDGGLKGSAKKKTTSLDGILSNMRRHRQIAEMEKQACENEKVLEKDSFGWP
uniref:PAXIP1-associated glutamate-rich protein 1 n=1 Tax=Timema douglasi TaxID=61478 RepID=A0A7R8Z6Z4_TIMDO|nr:unnamed protein product [Timema douglasi]